MAEETVTEGRVIALLGRVEERQEAGFEQVNMRLQAFRDSAEARFNNLEQRTARLEGGFQQMDKRLDKMEVEIGDLRSELKMEMGSLRTELKTEIGDLRTEVKTEIGDLRKDLRQVLFVIIGTWVTIMLTLLLKNV